MVHACVCCRLRFATNTELADHVRAEHSEHEEQFHRDTVEVVRHHFPEHAPSARERRAARS
jgi:hypothetical protein